MRFGFLSWVMVLSVSCVHPGLAARVDALQQELLTLRAELKAELKAELESELRPPAPPLPPALPSFASAEEEAAMELYREAADLASRHETEAALKVLSDLQARYPSSRAASAALRLDKELKVVGRRPTPLDDVRWYQGEASWEDATATLVVFWEVWCPHCTREVPRLEATSQIWEPRGLQVVALTKLTRGRTDEEVRSFILEHQLTFPVGWEDGRYAEQFSVSGVPAAAVVRDGVVIWRGHPAQINDGLLAEWVGFDP